MVSSELEQTGGECVQVEQRLVIFALFMCFSVFSSRCPESQRESALLLGQFATTDPECKV
jgi:hypothetical protein